MIRFLLNRKVHVEERLDPNLTILGYLRRHLDKASTKEGYASGDYGACTMVVGELITGENGVEHARCRSLNSCLTFVSALRSKQSITVKDLKCQDRLRSVQQAMVDYRGSQYGFCTSGFVTSLFALQKNSTSADPAKAHEALTGGLYRCTGYRPTLDTVEQAYHHKRTGQFDAQEAATIEQLRAIAPRRTAELNSGDRRCLLPFAVANLVDLYGANPQARLLAGGTDPALEATQFHCELPVMIYADYIREVKRIEVGVSCLEIGAATPLTDCYQVLAADYPDFGELLQRSTSLQIHNQDTLGGNISNASPIDDTPSPLIALDAKIVLRRGKRRRELPLEEYFLDCKVTAREEGEFIEKVLVPRARPSQAFKAYKVSKRVGDDISTVCTAIGLDLEDGRVARAGVAFGGMAAIPERAAAREATLQGAHLKAASSGRAAAALTNDFTPLSDFRASKECRLLTVQNLLRRCFLELHALTVETRVTTYI